MSAAGSYAEAYPFLKKTVLTWGDLGELTLPRVLGLNQWIIILILVVEGLLLFRWFEKKGL